MQPSRSHQSLASLRDLSSTFDKLSFSSRTATSTPVPRHKLDSSRGSILTPPADGTVRDPFLHPPTLSRQPSKDRGLYLESQAEDNVFGGGAKLQDDHFRQSETPANVVAAYISPNSKLAPRSDRLTVPITAQNAQGVLPPETCIFVANLLNTGETEDHIGPVKALFSQFGPCFVQAKKDRNQHHFALVQYCDAKAADKAVRAGVARMLSLDNRVLRTEYVNAKRSLVVTRKNPEKGPITQEEVEEILGTYGPLKEIRPATNAELDRKSGPGIFAKFMYFLDGKECLQTYKENPSNFEVELTEPSTPEAQHRTKPPHGNQFSRGARTGRSTTCQKSIYLGNLPLDITEEELKSLFAPFGEIKGCNVIRRTYTEGGKPNVFGFIEYSNNLEAEHAAEAEMDIRGVHIRIEPKEYSARRGNAEAQGYTPYQPDHRRGVPWGYSSGTYRPPPAMHYNLSPMYYSQPPLGIPPYSAYGYAQTPPSSGPRKRAPTGADYMYGGSPQPYMVPGFQSYAPASAQYNKAEPDDHQHPSRQYQ